MKLIESKVMRGPNQWSIDETQLIVAKFELPALTPEKEQSFRRARSRSFLRWARTVKLSRQRRQAQKYSDSW
jgi:hypothetical protein